MIKTLIIYSTTDGHTVKICNRIIQTLHQAEHVVELISVDDAGGVDVMLEHSVVNRHLTLPTARTCGGQEYVRVRAGQSWLLRIDLALMLS